MAAWAVLPLIASNRPIGSVLLSYDRPRPFPPSERAILTSLAGLVGQALDRARLYDNKDRLAHRLQSALLPTACRASPACGSSPAICCGRARSGHRRRLLRPDPARREHGGGRHRGRAGAQRGRGGPDGAGPHRRARPRHRRRSPDHVLGGTNRLLTDLDPGLFTSCLYAHLDLGNRRACLATAGHPPPLMRHCDGRTELLAVPPGLLLGIDPTARYPSLECALPPGCVLVLYTDGLVEAPGVDPDDATAALAGLVEQSDPRDLEAMADTLVRHARRPATTSPCCSSAPPRTAGDRAVGSSEALTAAANSRGRRAATARCAGRARAACAPSPAVRSGRGSAGWRRPSRRRSGRACPGGGWRRASAPVRAGRRPHRSARRRSRRRRRRTGSCRARGRGSACAGVRRRGPG